MDFGKLSASERTAAIAATVVLVLGIVSIVNDWGGLMAIPILGVAIALAALFVPQVSPTTQLPASTGVLLVGGGGAAAAFWVIAAISWLDWIAGHLAAFDKLQFLVGLVASIVLAWAAWQVYRVSGSSAGPEAAG